MKTSREQQGFRFSLDLVLPSQLSRVLAGIETHSNIRNQAILAEIGITFFYCFTVFSLSCPHCFLLGQLSSSMTRELQGAEVPH